MAGTVAEQLMDFHDDCVQILDTKLDAIMVATGRNKVAKMSWKAVEKGIPVLKTEILSPLGYSISHICNTFKGKIKKMLIMSIFLRF